MEQPQQTPETPQQEETIFNDADYSMKGYDKHIKVASGIIFQHRP